MCYGLVYFIHFALVAFLGLLVSQTPANRDSSEEVSYLPIWLMRRLIPLTTPSFLDEVAEQPGVLLNLVMSYADDFHQRLQEATKLIRGKPTLLVVGMGSLFLPERYLFSASMLLATRLLLVMPVSSITISGE